MKMKLNMNTDMDIDEDMDMDRSWKCTSELVSTLCSPKTTLRSQLNIVAILYGAALYHTADMCKKTVPSVGKT
jgi:hypothetical protein